MQPLTQTHLRYLLAIYDLGHIKPDVSAVEIAKTLNISKASVSRMLGILMDRGLLVRERYGKIYLTDTGFLLARQFKCNVEFLKTVIPKMGLNLTEPECLEAACLLAAALPGHCFTKNEM